MKTWSNGRVGPLLSLLSCVERNQDKIIQSVQQLHREVPIRLASRIVDLENLPSKVLERPAVQQLRELLLFSFDRMRTAPLPMDLAMEKEYMQMQLNIRQDHVAMHGQLSTALHDIENTPALQALLDRFYSSRIGIRLLIDQHLATQQYVPHHIGVIAHECDPIQLIRQVAPTQTIQGPDHIRFKYVPSHLVLILTEVLQRARHAVHQHVLVAGGARGVAIQITDVHPDALAWQDEPQLWHYGHALQGYDPVTQTIPERTGFGLPIARLYARYFGGDLKVLSMEGHSTTTYIQLQRLHDDWTLV